MLEPPNTMDFSLIATELDRLLIAFKETTVREWPRKWDGLLGAGLLIQGSVQPPPISLKRANWEDAMRGMASEIYSVEWTGFSVDKSLTTRAEELTRQKYSSAAYNYKR